MKIELIIPPNPYLGDDKRNPPLGLLYVAAAAEQAGYNPLITDLRGKKPGEFADHIQVSDIYGITASTPDYPRALTIAEIAKQKNPKSWTVLGGIHATALPQEINNLFDKVVVGEGEDSFIRLLEDFSINNHSNRFYKIPAIANIDSIPFPARSLLPFDSVFSKNAFKINGDYAGTIITSRGCANNCSFCASDKMWHRKVRFRSPDNVVEELRCIIDRYKVRDFRFQDDTMTLKKDRLEELCRKMIPLDIRWRATTRVDQADESRLQMMKEAGCEELGYGVESLSQEVLDKHAKMINLDQVYRALENTAKVGLKSRLFLIIGLPGEPPGYSERLEAFLKKANPDGVDLSTLVPYPGSDIYHNPQKYNIRFKNQDFGVYHMTLGLVGGEVERPLTFIHDKLSEEEIIFERKKSLEIIRQRKMIKNF